VDEDAAKLELEQSFKNSAATDNASASAKDPFLVIDSESE
jgi:hypothetical protein